MVPTVLRRPPTEADEWRLVRVSVRLTDIERSGDTWRAEVALADGSELPVVGLAGANISSEPLEPGRTARITGIVRRAHPSASDQRFAIAPRSRKDIRLGRAVAGGERDTDDDGEGGDTDDGDDDASEAAYGVAGSEGPGSSEAGVLTATFGSLEQLDDRLVRVGGRVEAVAERRLTLDDGTARGVVRLGDAVEPIEPRLQVGEVINVTGRVTRGNGGRREVVVETTADVRRAAALDGGAAEGALQTGTMPLSASLVAGLVGPQLPTTPVPEAGAAIPVPLVLAAGFVVVAIVLLVSAALFAWRSRDSLAPPTRTDSPPARG